MSGRPIEKKYRVGPGTIVRATAGRGRAEVFVPQSHRQGGAAEVDFGEVVVRLAGPDVSRAAARSRILTSPYSAGGNR